MRKKNFIKSIFFILLLVALVGVASSQAGRGNARINGLVLDEDGNPVKDAKIMLEFLSHEIEDIETKTDESGKWAIIGLGTGMARVTVTADGYIPTATEIRIQQLSRNPLVQLTLKKGGSSSKPVIEDELTIELFERGNNLFAEKKYDEAISVFEQFLEKNPNVYQAHLNIGDCYREKGELEKAIEEYNIVLEHAKEDETSGREMTAKALANIGDCYLKRGDYENAQDFFRKSIESYPENEILAYNVGEIFFASQKVDEAIHYFELASQIKSDWGLPYWKLGYAYLNKGDNESALKYFKKFLEIDPNSPEAPSVQSIIDYLEKSE